MTLRAGTESEGGRWEEGTGGPELAVEALGQESAHHERSVRPAGLGALAHTTLCRGLVVL